MKEKQVSYRLKLIFSIFLGLIISFITLYLFGKFMPRTIVVEFTVFILYVSLILILVLWNIIKSKHINLLLCIPIIYIVGSIAIIGNSRYKKYINGIPRMVERNEEFMYQPFVEYNRLARLDEESKLKITDNLPVLDGATAFYPVYASFVQAVYPEGIYHYWDENSPVLCSRTPNAYKNLLEEKADIIFCLEPSETQKKQFHENGLNLKFAAIGREAFVFFVNKKNPVNNLAINEIYGIYSGQITNWKKLNGANQSIRAYQRSVNSGSQTIFEKIMNNIPIMEPKRENVVAGMDMLINEVANYRNFNNAIGYSFLFYSTEMVQNNQIKLLSIDGIYPSRETVHDDSYPFKENIYAIYIDDDNKNENIELFIEWILSRQGQELIAKTGYIPVINRYEN